MSRMLKALKQLEVRSPQPQQASESVPPQEPSSPPQPPPEGAPQPDLQIASEAAAAHDTAIQAAFSRVETAAAALRLQQDQEPSDSPTNHWPLQTTRQHARAYRELAENVLSQVPPGRPTVLMVTSPTDGEGKTELLAALAGVLAERTPQRVLLIDGNLHKPDLASCLGVPAARGLAQVLMGAASWQQVVQQTSVPHLDLLPGVKFSTPHVRLPEHLNLRPLLDELRRQYRLILIDTASLAHAEVAPIAGYCDGTYLVVRLRHTARRDLARAVKVIQDCRGHLLGSVVIGA